MTEYLRRFDTNLARRRLRELTLDLVASMGLDPAEVPHTFDTEDLLSFTAKFSRRRDVRDGGLHLDLLERYGVVAMLTGDEAEALRIFERGRRSAGSPPERARFLYLNGLYHHYRRGEFQAARTVLTDALKDAELSRSLKSDIRLALGQTQRQLREFEAAEREYRHLIDHGVLESRPVALHYLAQVRVDQELYDEAEALNRECYRLFKADRDLFGMWSAQATRGDILLVRGELDAAADVLGQVAGEHARLLNMSGAGSTFHNLGIVNRRLGRHTAALDAYANAIRFYAPGGRAGLLSSAYRSLAICLKDMGRAGAALAALERATGYATGVGSAELEFRSHVAALETILDLRLPRNSVVGLTRRCRQLMVERPDDLSPVAYREFAAVSAELVALSLTRSAERSRSRRRLGARRLSTSEGREELKAVTGDVSEDAFERLLLRKIGSGLEMKHSPPPDSLRGFLMLFTGDRFKFGNYAAEFSLSQGRAKPHLRALCERGIIELTGQRKASSYSLSFHRA